MKIKCSFVTNSSSTSFIFKGNGLKPIDVMREFVLYFYNQLDKEGYKYNKNNKIKVINFLNRNIKSNNDVKFSNHDFGDGALFFLRFNQFIIGESPYNLIDNSKFSNILSGAEFNHPCLEGIYSIVSDLSCDPKLKSVKLVDIETEKVSPLDIECDMDDIKDVNEEIASLPQLKKELLDLINTKIPMWRIKISKTKKEELERLQRKIKRIQCIIILRKLLNTNYYH